MPPLPSTFDNETQDLISSLQRRQKDIYDFQIPRLRDCRGPLTVQQNLQAELREDLETFARLVEELDVLVGDQKGERSRRELRQIVEDFRAALVSLRKNFRAALLSSKRAIDSQKYSLREDLLGSSAVKDRQGINEKMTEDALMKANDDVTEALRRTVVLMQNELERSVLTTQVLNESSTTLKSTSNIHDTLNNVMDTSQQLIVALEKSGWLDRILIISGLVFFTLVVLFILKQRIVDRGLRIAFWWTRFLPSLNAIDVAKSTGTGVGEALGATATAVLTSSPSVFSILTTKHKPLEESSDETALHGPTLTAVEYISSITVTSNTYAVPGTSSRSSEQTAEHVDPHDEL